MTSYDHWKTTPPEELYPEPAPEKSPLERLGIESVSYVLHQYINDVRFSSTLNEGQKERRIEMIEAALEEVGDE